MKKPIIVILALIYIFLGANMLFAFEDPTPDAFTFTDRTNVALNTEFKSNAITVSGINTASPISVTGGTYSINGAAYTSASGNVSLGNTVKVRKVSAGTYSTTKSATLTIGTVSDTFSVTTMANPVDTTPDAFHFTDRTDVALSTEYKSNAITVAGINTASPISIVGGTYAINGGTYTSASGTVSLGNTVKVRKVSSSAYSTTKSATLTIGGVSDTFSVTTLALKAFVTSTSGTGDLNSWTDAGGASGLAAGDAVCQARATAGGLLGTYKAWLSTSTIDAYCHIQGYTGTIAANCGQGALPVAAGPWVRTDGYPFADTIDKLVNNGQIYTPVRYDETGTLVLNPYFTGTQYNGTYASGANCSDWTVAVDDSGLQGRTEGTTTIWTSAQGTSCGATARLLCFQYGTSGPLPAMPPPALSKKVFVTSTTYNGNLGGLSGADSICQARAAAGGVDNPTKFKAWLSTSIPDVEAKNRFTFTGPWYRLDGVKVADSKADLTDLTLFTAISYTEIGEYFVPSYTNVWTGTGADGMGSIDNCSNWTDGTTGFNGTYGDKNWADVAWTNNASTTCSHTYRLYCFEDE